MTPAETIAFVSVISSGVVGIVAVARSLVGGRLDRAHARTVRREDRRQERVEQTYEVLVAYVEKCIRISARIRPIITFTNEPPTPTLTEDEIDRTRALVDLHASPEVDRLVDEFSETLRKRHDAERALSMNEQANENPGPPTGPDPFLDGLTGWSRTCSCRLMASPSCATSRTGFGSRYVANSTLASSRQR